MRKVSTTVLLDQENRDKLERLMAEWHLSLSGAIRKLIEDCPEPKPLVKPKFMPGLPD